MEVARKKRLEEERAEEERRKEVERQRDLKWGLKYGHDYKRYTIEDIKHIYDEEFLSLLGLKFWGPAQPKHWFEEQIQILLSIVISPMQQVRLFDYRKHWNVPQTHVSMTDHLRDFLKY